jgi:hypothetical protein
MPNAVKCAASTFLIGSSKYVHSTGGEACNHLILFVWEMEFKGESLAAQASDT